MIDSQPQSSNMHCCDSDSLVHATLEVHERKQPLGVSERLDVGLLGRKHFPRATKDSVDGCSVEEGESDVDTRCESLKGKCTDLQGPRVVLIPPRPVGRDL